MRIKLVFQHGYSNIYIHVITYMVFVLHTTNVEAQFKDIAGYILL